ncbi:trigger factor [Mycoplasmopsis glycophila]|uniref:Trigger factor n=1 Tax=Mycoplasmopsis glycophila TaxID=171285 RepID=A0A449AUF5_9BACT|nr:trigger factor [Mycoplasmopsis glycophila]VEU70137.1 Trigger factor [Mycoplasmopsis glycophila]
MIKHELNNDKKELLVSVEVPSAEIQPLLEAKIEAQLKKVKVPGYRPGKAPRDKALARVDYDAVNRALVDELFNLHRQEVLKYLEENKLTGAQLVYDFETKENGDVVLKYILLQTPDFSGVKLDQLKAKIGNFELTKEGFDEKYNEFLASLSLPVALKEEQELQNGDTVNINFKGFINDQPFDGGEAEGYDLVLGSKSFIPGFEEQLEGKKIGWEGSIKVTFPENYFSKEFQGKDAVFEIKINSATRKEAADLDDEKVKLFQIPNVENIAQLKEMFENRWKVEKLVEASNAYMEDVVSEIANDVKAQVHSSFLDQALEQLRNNFNSQLKQYKIKKTEYLSLIKSSEEELEAQFKEEALNNVAREFSRNWVLSEVLAKNEEVDSFVQDLKEANQYKALFGLLLTTKNLLEKTKSYKVADFSKAVDALKANIAQEQK